MSISKDNCVDVAFRFWIVEMVLVCGSRLSDVGSKLSYGWLGAKVEMVSPTLEPI